MFIFPKSLTINFSKLHSLKSLFIISAIVIFFYSCQKSSGMDPIDCSGPAKSFATDVNPIIQSTCATDSDCHGTGSNSGPGQLLNYSQIFNARADIRIAVLSGTMPKDGHLSATQRNVIICWIDNGSQNN
jgi:hypothetical protein